MSLVAQLPSLTQNPYLSLIERATAHARQNGAEIPALSPLDKTVLGGEIPVAPLQQLGCKVIPWTTNDPETMRAVIRTGVDGLISDRPDILQRVLAEERGASPDAAAHLAAFDVQGHRGARGLRPENTLPAFEAGLDHGIRTIETDTGVTADGVSLIWHDQFLNPLSCRKVDGSPYTVANRVFIRDLSFSEAQRTFICDKVRFGKDQTNELSLSPVSVAFAKEEQLISPYVPICTEQLVRFVRFYAAFYRTGAGKNNPMATVHASTGEKVRFNLETKILPTWHPPAGPDGSVSESYADLLDNHTVDPQRFVDVLCGAIQRSGTATRTVVQSFDFRTLLLVAEQHPKIATCYLTEDARLFSTDFVPPLFQAE